MTDPYQVLGLARNASQDEIKKAYRKLARTLHPDLNPNDKKAEDKFKQVNAAFDLLSDPDKRARFDRGEIDAAGNEKPRYSSYRSYAEGAGANKYRNPFDMGEAEDILAELLRRRDKGRARAAQMRGGDAHYNLKVSFTEAAAGATKRITLPHGKSLNVRIPPGTEDKQSLRLKGQGNPGLNGGEAGDAFVEIAVEPHPFFKREGNDIHVELPVTLPEAVLGGKVVVPTIDGKVTVTVPPGSNSGSVLRLKGKGVPHGKERGDQFVKLRVTLPDKPDPELEAFIRRWAESHAYDVRAKAGMS